MSLWLLPSAPGRMVRLDYSFTTLRSRADSATGQCKSFRHRRNFRLPGRAWPRTGRLQLIVNGIRDCPVASTQGVPRRYPHDRPNRRRPAPGCAAQIQSSRPNQAGCVDGAGSAIMLAEQCGRSIMVMRQLPKLLTRVRFPSPAPIKSTT
jgi:hypothetical protein